MILIEKHFQNIHIKIQELPDKLNFKIGEVSDFLKVPAYVLRYWEKEFSALKPDKKLKQRLYSKRDIKILLLIKTLLYEEKFSIEGLRKHLDSYIKQLNKDSSEKPKAIIEKKIHDLLNSLNDMRDQIH